ncbi:glycosyltransferase family 4 protein [Thermodesulfobacterium sp. TA1]|uniref:glycosyltransferase family 4 protein n=1 Tax=Thermodesulfobacterium sp. TA1 TaxID=2234087 RepID=UPI0012329F7E|nr:glycosyltransferase family 4 protein [Thermodesulfobacterium sp. TA1]QER42691.1 glycosyltransferase family 4 protein [Thermodesulfobacterium sp. TA1]
MEKLILLRPKIGFGIGGAESHAGMVVVKLLERGFKVGVVAHTIVFPEEILKKLEVYKVRWRGFGSVPKQLLFIYQAKKILDNLSDYRLISFFRYPYPSDLFILCDPLVAFLQKQKRSILKNFSFRYKILLSLEKEALSKAKKVVSLFSLGKDLVKEFYPEIYEKTIVCYRGMDFKRFNPELKKFKEVFRKELGFSKEDFLILFVGYDAKRKGLPLLLKILSDLPERVKLLVIGIEGRSTSRVVYLGKVKEIEKYYAMADLFALPTLYDPGALATLEALATGTPVVTTPYDGTSEFVREGINGFVVERTEETFKKAILKALVLRFDPEKVYQTISHLTWDGYVDCLISQLGIL